MQRNILSRRDYVSCVHLFHTIFFPIELILLCCNFITHHYIFFSYYTPLHIVPPKMSTLLAILKRQLNDTKQASSFTGNMQDPMSSTTSRKRCSSSTKIAPKPGENCSPSRASPRELLQLAGYPMLESPIRSQLLHQHRPVPDFDE